MSFAASITGVILIVLSVVYAIYEQTATPMLFYSVPTGVFFLSLAKIIDLLVKIEARLSGNQPALQQGEYHFTSTDFEVHEQNNETYRLIKVDGRDFVQARIFKNYLDVHENSITFSLPGKEKVELTQQQANSQGANLFMLDGTAYVKLSVLGINAAIVGNTIRLKYVQQ